MVRLLLAGGGSVGHLSPCLAVAQELERRPDVKLLTVCSNSPIEKELLLGKPVKIIFAPKLRRYASLRTFLLPFGLLTAITQSAFILSRYRPGAILATGGPIGMPVCLAGALLRIPIVLFEPDARLGITTRLCRRFAKKICIGQEAPHSAEASRGKKKYMHTGFPVRGEITKGSEDAGRAITGFSGKRPVLIVLGGSQGAAALNEAVRDHLPFLLDLCDVIHITGKGKGLPIDHARYVQFEFMTGDLPHMLTLADLALTRGGANMLAELAAAGIPAVICPLPGSAQDHQRENAKRYADAGAAVVLEQGALHQELLPTIRALLSDDGRRQRMTERMRLSYRADAAGKIAEALLGVVGSHR